MSALTPDETTLGLLAIQKRHGYELLGCFCDKAQLGAIWKLSASRIYAVPKRMEQRGWIIGEEIAQPNAPPRTDYRLTSSGEKRLSDWLDDPCPSASIRRVRVEFLSRLYIARALHLPTIPIVQRQKRACSDELESLMARRYQVAAGMSFFAPELLIAQLQAVLSGIDHCEMISSTDER